MNLYAFNLSALRRYRVSPKILLIMRIIIIIMTGFLMQVNAASFAQKLTYSKKGATLSQVFKEIKTQTGYNVFYSNEQLNKEKKIDVRFNQTDLKEVLEELSDKGGLEYVIDAKNISIKSKKATLMDKVMALFSEIDVRGRVVDENGKPLVGASIGIVYSNVSEDKKDGTFSAVMVGRKVVTLTGENGEFEMKNIDDRMTVAITYIGYETYTVKAAKDLGTIQLKLSGNLDEVIVSTGYQKISKERSAGSFAKPDMKIITDRSNTMNILQRLDGLVPGMVINNAPNGISAKRTPFLIRGLNTIVSDKNPLVVVDGIAMDMNNISSINPQDVEDISILKDATAASIWGARASNGVIVIVTRKGKSGATRINYDGFVNFQGRPEYDYFPVLNSAQYIQASKETFDPVYFPYNTATTYNAATGVMTGISPDRQILFDMNRGALTQAQGNAKLDSLSRISNLSQIGDVWYRPAMLMNHSLSFAGGGEKHTFYNSFAYTNTRDYTPGNKDQTFKINTRQDYKFNKYLSAYLIADINYRKTASENYKTVDNRFLPYQLFKDASGNSISMPYMGYLSEVQRPSIQNLSKLNLNYNPLDDSKTGSGNSNEFTGRFNAGITANIVKGLQFEGVYGYIRGTSRSQRYDDHTNYQQRINIVNFATVGNGGAVNYNLPNAGGQYAVNNTNQDNWVIRNQLSYNSSWKNDLHQLTVLFGQEAQEMLTVANRSLVYGYNQDLQTYAMLDYKTLTSTKIVNPILMKDANGSVLDPKANGFFGESESVPRSRFTSYYANGAYTFDRKYTINASWRNDQSNLFGINKSAQRKPVWSVGLKWSLTNEAWMKGLSNTLSQLALRATYGLTGISPTPGYSSSKDVLSPYATPNAPGGQSLIISTLANPNLTWEQTKTYNLGLDFGLLDNRITGSVDVYKKNTSNLLGRLPVNPLSGVNSINGNVGSLTNKGIEITVNSANLISKDFQWNTTLVAAYNKNKITDLGLQATTVTTGAQQIDADYTVGYPAFAIFAYNYAGLDNLGDPQVRKADGTITKKLGETLPEDVLYMGTYQPKWSGGLSNAFRYKDFSFNMNIVYNLGHVMYRDVNRTFSANGFISNQNFQSGNLHAEFANRWKQAGDEANTNIPSFVADASTNATRRYTDYYVRGNQNIVSASYAKIRDMSISYSMPSTIVKKIKAQGLTFRLQLSNVMLWKANQYGIDPEFQDGRFGLYSGMPNNQKTITIGAHLTL
jgi:TonB-linked SusC/RagA family outer membrane protein